MAELTTDPQERAEWLTFVVIGAGPTGVELAGQMAELAHKVLPKDYRSVDTHEARIILLEGAPSVLPPFKPKLQKYTQEQLEKMGVEIRLNTLAVDMDHESITVKGPNGHRDDPRPHPDLGGRACRPRRWPRCWPRRPAPRPTGPAGSRSTRTAACRATPRSSRSATWCC